MIDIATWTQAFINALDASFGQRIWFVGLQGSYGRGEATEDSDIDMVVILDTLSADDVLTYRALLDSLAHRDKACGFLAGQEEITHWDAADLFQLYHDTLPLRGSLDTLLPRLDDQAVERAIHLGACNIYHGCVHNMIYAQKKKTLRGLYKQAVYVIQAIHYRATGHFVRRQQDLENVLDAPEQAILRTWINLRAGQPVELADMSQALLAWARHWVILGGRAD